MYALGFLFAAVMVFVALTWPRKRGGEHVCGEACGPRQVEDDPPPHRIPTRIELLVERREIEKRLDHIRHRWHGAESVQEYCRVARELSEFDEDHPEIGAMFK